MWNDVSIISTIVCHGELTKKERYSRCVDRKMQIRREGREKGKRGERGRERERKREREKVQSKF
jgi:hypothetical protein